MGKDREGNYHPPKGKPSDTGNKKGITSPSISKKEVKKQDQLEDKYDVDADNDSIENVKMMHPNRNENKDLDRQNPKEDRDFKHKSFRGSAREDTIDIEELSLMELDELLEVSTSTNSECISIYMPIDKSGVAVNEQVNKTLFKNLMKEARNSIREESILLTVEDVLNDDLFWSGLSSKGLAVFVTTDFVRYLQLPTAPKSSIHNDNLFNVIPLIPHLSPSDFFLLAITKKGVKFFLADKTQLKEIDIPGMPWGMDDVIHFEEKGDQKLFRTESSSAGEGASFHGMGAGKPDEKKNVEMYLAEVDRTLWKEFLHDKKAPLILAGVDYMVAIYRNITKYNNVWEQAIDGSPAYADEHELHNQACELLESYFKETQVTALEKYGDLSATTLSSDDTQEIVRAAFDARIDTLFVKETAPIWGSFDIDSRSVARHNEKRVGDKDLLNLTATQTMINGGKVYLVEEDEAAEMKAIFRY